MSTDQRTGEADANGSPTIDSTATDNHSDNDEGDERDERDPYEKYSEAHGTIRDDGSPLVDDQLYPSTVEEHMRLIEEQASRDDDPPA